MILGCVFKCMLMVADGLLTQGFSLGKAMNDKLPALAKANTQAKASHSLLIPPRLKPWVNNIIHLGTQPDFKQLVD